MPKQHLLLLPALIKVLYDHRPSMQKTKCYITTTVIYQQQLSYLFKLLLDIIETETDLPVSTYCTIFLMWCWHAKSAVATEIMQNISRTAKTVVTKNARQTNVDYVK